MADIKNKFVTWSRELETGVSFVDEDHKVLVNLLNQANACIDQNEESTVLGSVLDALLEYTGYHFLREERMMAYAGYEGLENHTAFHRTLKSKVQGFCDAYQKDPASVDANRIRAFLRAWVNDHIIGYDFAYCEVCKGNPDAVVRASREPFFSERPPVDFADWRQVRVMLVDDNPNIRKLIQTLLKAAGVRKVEVMETPQDGLARLSQRHVDVVLCDWVMEGMNGTEFARIVDEMALPTRIIMMTGYSTDVLRERSSKLNVFGFLEKPVKVKALLEMIAKAAPGDARDGA